MEYDGERTYSESEWAVRRWDWFHGGRIVEPLSFCQFWRTVLVWASIKWLASPLIWLDRVTSGRTLPSLPMPSIPWRFALLPVKGCWLVLRESARGLWRLTYPLRCAARPVGGAALAGVVSGGEGVADFGERHKEGLKVFGVGVIVIIAICEVVVVSILLLFESWFWTLIGTGIGIGIGFALYGFFKSGVLRLLWDVAVVVHHGICPPVRIVRA